MNLKTSMYYQTREGKTLSKHNLQGPHFENKERMKIPSRQMRNAFLNSSPTFILNEMWVTSQFLV